MLKKTIKFTDYNGLEREEVFYFNLNKAEIADMELTTKGGLTTKINAIIETKDAATLVSLFKDIILKSYGEKSTDGLRFVKKDSNGRPLSEAFAETEAFTELYMELILNSDAASAFINGIIPQDVQTQAKSISENKK